MMYAITTYDNELEEAARQLVIAEFDKPSNPEGYNEVLCKAIDILRTNGNDRLSHMKAAFQSDSVVENPLY